MVPMPARPPITTFSGRMKPQKPNEYTAIASVMKK